MKLTPAESSYRYQKSKARLRGIEFDLTFEQWHAWWKANGRDPNVRQPNTADALCMCRKGDRGAYRSDNIYCATRKQNSQDAKVNFPSTGRAAGFGKRVSTPAGKFEDARQAAEYYNMSYESIIYRCNSKKPKWQDWVWLDKESKNGMPIQTPLGQFPSQRQAAYAIGVPVSTIQRYRKTKPTEYYYV